MELFGNCDIAQTRKDMTQILLMSTWGPVASSIRIQAQILQFGNPVIDEIAASKSKLMEHVYDEYYPILGSELHVGFAQVAIVPWEIKEVEIDGELCEVPVAYPPGSFDLDIKRDRYTGEEKLIVRKRYGGREEIENYERSTLWRGPMLIETIEKDEEGNDKIVNKIHFDTPCGSLLPDYRDYMAGLDRNRKYLQMQHPPKVFLRCLESKHATEELIDPRLLPPKEVEDAADVDKQYGRVTTKRPIIEDKDEKYVILPPLVDTTSQQPPPLTLYDQVAGLNHMKELASSAFSVGNNLFHDKGAGSIIYRNSDTVNKQSYASRLSHEKIAADIGKAIANVWRKIYDKRVKVTIPVRPELDLPRIEYLLNQQAIPQDYAHALMMADSGLYPHHKKIYLDMWNKERKRETKKQKRREKRRVSTAVSASPLNTSAPTT